MIEADITQTLANSGILGIILAWFMFRMEKVVNNNTKTLQEVKIAIASCPTNKKRNS